jgi:YHS domain-containing protein
MRTLLAAALVAGAVLGIGCSNTGGNKSMSSSGPSYHEVWYNGDTYVFPSAESKQAFIQSGKMMPPSKTYINAAPNGSDVVVKSDPDNPGLAEWLFRKYKEKHGMS